MIAMPGVPDVADSDEVAAQGSQSLGFNGFTLLRRFQTTALSPERTLGTLRKFFSPTKARSLCPLTVHHTRHDTYDKSY